MSDIDMNFTEDLLYTVDELELVARLDNAYYIIQNVLTALYGVLSMSLVCHFFVAAMLIRIITSCKCRDTVHNCIYVLALTVVDAIVISHLPLLAVEIVQQQWTFGLAWCRFFWVAESVNKLLSTFLLTALCFDRYIAVCYPLKAASGGLRRPRTACFIILICACSALVLLSPIYSNVQLDDFELAENRTVVKCVVDWSENVEQYFTITLFLIGYCIPLLLMAFFYSRIIVRLRKRSTLLGVSTSSLTNGNGCGASHVRQLKAVTKRSFALVLFYFLCWTPFWVISFNVNTVPDSSNGIVTAFYFMHALVYLNSAMNPVFYVLLNRQLRSYVIAGKTTSASHSIVSPNHIRMSKTIIAEEGEVAV